MLCCAAAGIAVLAVIVAICWWIMFRMPGKSFRGELPPMSEAQQALSRSLRQDVVHLAEKIGPRDARQNRESLQKAAAYIEGRLRAAGYEVTRQEFLVEDFPCHNLVVEIPGTGQADEIVVVGAHYDTIPSSPGANDNTTGVAALLALAERFAGRRPQKTLRFVAFSCEEPPYFQTSKMGSRVYARSCRKAGDNIVAMLCVETIGYYTDKPGTQEYPGPIGWFYPSVGNFIAVVGNTASRSLVRQVVGTFRRHAEFPCEGGAVPGSVTGVGWSDHWSFWQEGYPAVMLTDTAPFRYRHYHTPQDTPDKLDFDRTARVVDGLEHVVADLAGEDADADTPAAD